MITIAMMITVITTTVRTSTTTTPITVLLELPLVSPVLPLLPSVTASVVVALEHVCKQQRIQKQFTQLLTDKLIG